MNSLPNASELLKKIVEEDPLFKLEVKNKYQEAEELKRWIVLVMKEVNLITEKISGKHMKYAANYCRTRRLC